MIDIRRREEQLHLCKKIIYMTLGIYMMMISICLAGQSDNLSKETSEKIISSIFPVFLSPDT